LIEFALHELGRFGAALMALWKIHKDIKELALFYANITTRVPKHIRTSGDYRGGASTYQQGKHKLAARYPGFNSRISFCISF
jgi:hypothetical protein